MRALSSTVGKDLLTLHGHVEQQEAAGATEEDLRRVHTEDHIRRVRDACAAAESRQKVMGLDADTMVSSSTWDAALGSAGASVAAATAVADGRLSSAFVATRPPGHHATRDRAMGFCLFNNIAIAARHLQATGRAERVLIVDWDVHHGNGTQEAFYDDPTVFYLSVHQAPWFPGSGEAGETGSGPGEGYTHNVPLRAGTPRDAYLRSFREAFGRVVDIFPHDIVLVSCGFDALKGDPLGGQLLEPIDFFHMAGDVVRAASERCEGKVVALLEGGYDPPRLGRATVAVVRALAGLDAPKWP